MLSVEFTMIHPNMVLNTRTNEMKMNENEMEFTNTLIELLHVHTHTDTKEFYSVYRCQITTGTADITFESCMKCLVLFHLAPLYPKCLVLCGVVRHCLLLRFRERANGIINIRELKTTLSSVNVMNIIVISYRILSSNVEYRISRSCVKSYATSKWK